MSKINLRSVDLNLLVALDVLLEECHISNSANRLNLSQSAMSHIFSRLRDTFGDQLLIRGPLGYEKTSVALEIESPLKDALRQVQLVFAENRCEPKTFEGKLTISTLGYGEAVIVPKLMELLAREAPNAKVNIVHRTNEPYDKVLSGDVDVLFGAHFGKLRNGYHTASLFADRYVCIMHKDHPLADKPLSLDEYLEVPHALIHPGVVMDNPIDEYFHQQGLNRKVTMISSNFFASILSLKNSLLVQVIPQRLARRISGAYELVEKELPFPVEQFEFLQLWCGKNQNNPIHRWFRDKIFEAAQYEAGVGLNLELKSQSVQ